MQVSTPHSFLLLINDPFHESNTFCLSNCILIDTWVAFDLATTDESRRKIVFQQQG